MSPAQTSVWIILGYLGLLIALGIYTSRKFKGTASDYFLASRGIGWFLLVMSLFGTTMTAFALIGSTGESFKAGVGVYGMMASSSGIVHSAVFFLVGIKLWAFGARHGYVTQIQFFRDRFESDKLGIILFPVLVGLVIPYLLIGVMGAGVTIENVTGGAFPSLFAGGGVGPTAAKAGAIPYWLGSGGICLVVLVYVFLGGVRGAAWANAFQTLVFIVLGIVTFFVISSELGGMKHATDQVVEMNPHSLRRTVRADDPLTRYNESKKFFDAKLVEWHKQPKSKKGPIPVAPQKPHSMTQLHFLTYLLIPLSVGMFPHLFQHWLTAKSAKSFKPAVILHPLLIMLVWVPCVMLGIWATSAMFGDPPKPVIPWGQGNPNAVLGQMVAVLTKGGGTGILPGLLTAGVLAAIMSSLDSQFLCIGSIFANDIVAHYLGHDRVSDRQKVVYGRVFVILIVVVTYLLSLQRPGSVFTLAVWCFSGFSGLFPLVFASIYWKRVTKAGAYACVIVMAAVWCWLFAQSGYGAKREFLFLGMMPVATILAASTLALIVVSLMTSPPGEKTLAKFFKS
ncbi:MAG: sodium:solute symporter family protein [Phycisphaerales bacterium]|nr:sodium:solute symporter family protein [Phycisphaerales bacterium]MCB9863811.1 sodium:solute symporter family protein [Phycisphaerales bacterium]